MQTACDDALSQLPDVSAVLGAPTATKPARHKHTRRAPRTHPAATPYPHRPAVPSPKQASPTPRTPVVVAVPAAKRTALVPSRPERRRATVTQIRKRPEPSLATLPADKPVREAAAAEKTDAPARPPLFLVAILLGLASLAVALGSLGGRRSAALTAIATRVRSKGLSSATRPRPAAEDAPPAIRYRE